MNHSPKIENIQNSLEAMQKVFAGIIDYRVLGSLLVAAINGKPHRELHDIDLLIDESVYSRVTSRFNGLGFKKITKNAPGFKWDEFIKPNHLTFGVLLKGRFGENYFEYKAGKWLTLQVKNQYLTATEYRLYGLPIRGIPMRSVYEGIKIASLNPKRKVDRDIVLKSMNSKQGAGLSIGQAFKVKICGLGIPYLYSAFSQSYNLLGGIRLRLGKTYDPWT